MSSRGPRGEASGEITQTSARRRTANSSASKTRKIALALLTLSWSPLNCAPLRSIVNGFYYLTAIISLLLLLIACLREAEAQYAGYKIMGRQFVSADQLGERLSLGPAKVGATKSASQPMKSAELVEQTQGKAELTFRHASSDDYSENNRGAQRNSQLANHRPANETHSLPLLPSGSQWRPVRRPTQFTSASPASHRPPISGPLAPSGGPETRRHPTGNGYARDLERHSRRLQGGAGGSQRFPVSSEPGRSRRRTWRRPRLSSHTTAGGFRQGGKMYKRVLICDKTLVSLDYVRDFAVAEPRPFPLAHYSFSEPLSLLDGGAGNDLDDANLIDLDLDPQFDPLTRRASAPVATNSSLLATSATSASSSTLAPKSTPSTTSTTTTTATSAATEAPSGGGDEDALAGEPTTLGRRSYQLNMLPDEDALVKCDMWDLEKGLKNRKPPGEVLELAVRADFDTVRDAINRCRQLTEKTLPPDDEYRDGIEMMSTEDLVSLFSMKRGLLPGTKWCGLGDQASTYNDLGAKHRIDICCRAHDHCPIRLKPFRNDYGVLNIALYTKSHCDCDADFYRCLREARSRTADMLGNLYFNVMKLQCIREERLKVCREVRPLALGFERCVRYEDSPMKRVFKFTTPPVAY